MGVHARPVRPWVERIDGVLHRAQRLARDRTTGLGRAVVVARWVAFLLFLPMLALGVVILSAALYTVVVEGVLGRDLFDYALRDADGAIVEAGLLNRAQEGNVRVGDCLVDEVGWRASWIGILNELEYVTGVPCSHAHDFEVYGTVPLSGVGPVDAQEAEAQAHALCAARLAEYTGRSQDRSLSAEAHEVAWWPFDLERLDFECRLASSDGTPLQGTARSR
jgi:hypothetical protein